MEALGTMETLVRNTKWQLQEAKAMLSELVKATIKEPQVITVRGEEKAVVISMNEYKRLVKEKQKPSLGEFLQNSPWSGIELEIPKRRIESMRDINL